MGAQKAATVQAGDTVTFSLLKRARRSIIPCEVGARSSDDMQRASMGDEVGLHLFGNRCACNHPCAPQCASRALKHSQMGTSPAACCRQARRYPQHHRQCGQVSRLRRMRMGGQPREPRVPLTTAQMLAVLIALPNLEPPAMPQPCGRLQQSSCQSMQLR